MIPASASPLIFGRYAVYDKIASGGMATIHLGRLLGPVGFARTVAIKRLHPQLAEDPEFVSMFMDEARLAARISHPNVVPTLDVVAVSGELFLVMEYVRGESIARLSKAAQKAGAPIPAPIASTIMVGVLQGLHAAHEATNERGELLGIVHRDISPQNILVGADGIPRLLDFGIAKAIGRIQTTREGQIKGKIAYMAPEQFRGRVSRSSDIYAAAIVLWEMLAGKRLFEGSNEGELLANVVRGCTTPPSAYAPGLPPALDAVTLRGLSADPAGRFETAADMAHALEEAAAIVSSSKVGAWVQSLAKETLADRNERLAAIESDSQPHPVAPANAPAGRRAPAVPTPVPDDATEIITQMSNASISVPNAFGSLPRRRWRVGAAIAGGLAALALGITLIVSITSRRAETSAASPSADVPSAAVASTVTPTPVAPTPVVPAATPAASTPIEALSAPPMSHALAPPPPPHRTAATASHAAPAPRANCNPPWYYNDRGMRIFKRECL